MSNFSGKTAEPAWHDMTTKPLPWLAASILAGLAGGIVALLVLNTELVVNIVGGLVDGLLDILMGPPQGTPMEEGGFNPLVVHLCGSIAGALGGAVSGLVYYASRRMPLRRATGWSSAWAIIGLLGTIWIVFGVSWIIGIWSSISGYRLHPQVAFLILSAIFAVLTATARYMVDPYGEEYG